MIKLSPLQAPLHDVLKFTGVVSRCRLLCHCKVGLNDITHIPQHHSSPLLDAFRRSQIEFSRPPLHNGFHFSSINGILHFIAPDVRKANGGTYINPINHPPHAWVPVNGLYQSSGSRGGDDVIADPLHLHFRSGKTGVISPDLYGNRHWHDSFSHKNNCFYLDSDLPFFILQ